MSGRYLLDSNVIIPLLAGEADLIVHLETAEEIFLPSIAVGELSFVARKSARPEENLRRIDELAAGTPVLGCDAETARLYGAIKYRLRVTGHPIPENDIWIAAIALQHGLTLVTRDRHFQEIEGLSIAEW